MSAVIRSGARKPKFLPEPNQPIKEHHIIAALNYMAYIVVRYGDVYAPIFERLERELEEFRHKRAPTDRARALLQAQSLEANAIF